MKAMFGVVSLAVVLALVGLLEVRQLHAVGHASPPARADVSALGAATAPALSGSGSLHEQSTQLRDKVANDTIKAMNAAATARDEDAAK